MLPAGFNDLLDSIPTRDPVVKQWLRDYHPYSRHRKVETPKVKSRYSGHVNRRGRSLEKSDRRIRRSVGYRAPLNRSLILRAVYSENGLFTSNSNTYDAYNVDIESIGVWVPSASATDDLTACRFNHCATKRLVGVHVYLTNMQSFNEVTEDNGTKTFVPSDETIYTYANPYEPNEPSGLGHNFMLKNGISKRLKRHALGYHSVLNMSVPSRHCTTDTLNNMNGQTWAAALDKYAVFSRTGSQGSLVPRQKINFWIMPVKTYSPGAPPVVCRLKFTIVIATKWRMYGSAPDAVIP